MSRKSLSLLLLSTLALALAGAGSFVLAAATVPAGELPLNPTGTAYEVNPDHQGFLWISD